MVNNYSNATVARRREEILRIVRASAVHSQEELLELLRKAGFHITQPTLSRDLRELGLAKTPTGYVVPEPQSAILPFVPKESREFRLEQALEEFALSVARAGNLVVLRTPAAAAQPLAHAIDEAQLPNVLGCIGGDDAIFVALSTSAAARKLVDRFRHSISPTNRSRRVGA